MLLSMSLIRSSSTRSLDSVTSVIAEHPAGQDPVPEGGRLSIRKRIANLVRGWFQPRNRQETEESDARSVSYDSDESRGELARLEDFNGMEGAIIAGGEPTPGSSDEIDPEWEPMPDSSDEIDEGREPMPDSLDEIDEEWEPMSDSSDEIDDGWELISSEE